MSMGDPLRLRCLAEKMAAGRTIHLSVVGGSVSFGTTFTTSKSRTLFHWKVYQYINGVPFCPLAESLCVDGN